MLRNKLKASLRKPGDVESNSEVISLNEQLYIVLDGVRVPDFGFLNRRNTNVGMYPFAPCPFTFPWASDELEVEPQPLDKGLHYRVEIAAYKLSTL